VTQFGEFSPIERLHFLMFFDTVKVRYVYYLILTNLGLRVWYSEGRFFKERLGAKLRVVF
jgi:hypothetical protein